MWLLIKEIRINKNHYMLFSSKEAALQFLDDVGAERKSADRFLEVSKEKKGGWEMQTPWWYTLKHLHVHGYRIPSTMDKINKQLNEDTQ